MPVGATFRVAEHVTEVLFPRCQNTWKRLELQVTGGEEEGVTVAVCECFNSCDLYENCFGCDITAEWNASW